MNEFTELEVSRFAETLNAFTEVAPAATLPRPLFTKESLDTTPVTADIVYGKAKVPLTDLLKMKEGDLINLDDTDDILTVEVNGKRIADGELVVTGDGTIALKITDIA